MSKLNQVIINDFNNKIDDAIKDIAATLEFDETILSAKNIFYEKSIKDILKIDDELQSRAAQMFINYINSDESLVFELCESLFSYIKKIDKTLFDIVDTSFEMNLKSYLLKNLPNVTNSIIDWVNSNSKSIDKIIEDSIDEVIKESDGIKGKLLNTIKNTYLNNLSEKYNVVQKIIDYIKKETEPEKLSRNISSKIINYLNNNSIGEIVTDSEKNNIITPIKASKYIIEYLNNYSHSIINEFFNHIKDMKVKDVLPKEFKSGNIIKEKIIEMIKEKILSSEEIHLALYEKAHNYIIKCSDKNINEIISEEYFKCHINDTDDFIVQFLNKNSDTIKNLIKKEINLDSLNVQSFNKINVSNLISAEIIEQYNRFTYNIKNKKLSLSVDKINKIDNLNKNSSEMLRTLIINNLDKILIGSVKAIVYENLNKLSDDELVNFANDFIGRELQPIMYFGGVLGAAAGLILAAVQNAPPDLGAITIENMATYAFVGFLTNVIAINMIFKPYKEIKFLSKIPFLRNFSIGYLVKNQKVFAENTARFVDKDLLSKESINKLFEKYETDIKGSFISGIVANDYSVLHKLFTNNSESIVCGSYEFTRNTIDKNVNNISNFALNRISKIRFSSLISPANINYLINFGAEKLIHANESINEFVFSKINSTKSLESHIPNNFINSAKLSINDFVEKYYNITSQNSKDINIVKNFLMKYDEKYKSSTNKPINEIFNSESIENFGSFSSKKLSELVLSESSRQKASNVVVALFNRAFEKNKTFDELFNGKIKEYVNKNIPSLFDKISSTIKNNIIENKGKVSINIKAEIKNNLGFIEKSMYSLMGGGDIVDELIHKIMVVKAPLFIDEKKYELLNIFSNTIDENFYKAKTKNLHDIIDKVQINKMLDTYFLNVENTAFIEKTINSVINTLKSKINNVNLDDILKILSLDDINNILNCYKGEINELISNLSCSMVENKKEIINRIMILLNEIVDEFMKSTSFNDLCYEILSDDVNTVLNNITYNLNSDDFFKKSLGNTINSFNEFTSEKCISEFIDKDEFVKSAEMFVKDTLNSDETEKSVKNLYSSILKESTDLNLNFISVDTKSYFIDIFVESSMKSIKRNLDSMLKTIEFDSIAQEEIEAMEPRKIHEMFNSFCGKYFTKLMLYGFGGFIFGINMYIGLSLTALKIIKEKFFKN